MMWKKSVDDCWGGRRLQKADTPVGSTVWFLTERINKLLISKPWGSLSPRIEGTETELNNTHSLWERHMSTVIPVIEDTTFHWIDGS